MKGPLLLGGLVFLIGSKREFSSGSHTKREYWEIVS